VRAGVFCKGNNANLSWARTSKHETILLFTCKGNNANLRQLSTGNSLLSENTYLSRARTSKHETEA